MHQNTIHEHSQMRLAANVQSSDKTIANFYHKCT